MRTFLKYKEDEDFYYFKPSDKLDLSVLKTIDYCSWFSEKSEIKVQIESSEIAEEPSKKQIETLHFILKNQEEILLSIFNFNQRFIYPIYNESIDIEEGEIVNTPSQLSRVYGIKQIEIPKLDNLDSSYFLIRFDFKYDDEHGLYFLFKNSSVIDFFSEGDKRYNAINLYQDGLTNDNGAPLEINVYKIPFQSVLKSRYQFHEKIKFPLQKGAYRVSIQCNGDQYCINIYTPIDLEEYSLKQISTIQ
jgi:hypothetical protein